MLAKQHRLVKQKDFEKVFKQGRSCYTKLLGVKILANQPGINRFGIVISTKISRKAVRRNRLKRQIRQAAGKLNEKLKSGFDAVIIASPGLLGQEYKIIAGELERVFAKLKLFNNSC